MYNSAGYFQISAVCGGNQFPAKKFQSGSGQNFQFGRTLIFRLLGLGFKMKDLRALAVGLIFYTNYNFGFQVMKLNRFNTFA